MLTYKQHQISELVEHCINGVNYWLDEKSKILYKTVDGDEIGEPIGFLPPITNGQEACNERLLEIVGNRSVYYNVNELHELIAAGADVNALHEQTELKPTVNPYPPLWRAVISNKIDLIPILIAAGADTTTQIGGKTLLEQTAEYYGIEYNEADTNSIGDDAIVKILIKRKEIEHREILDLVDILGNSD